MNIKTVRLLQIITILCFATACSKKSADHGKVVFKFDKSILGKSSSNSSYMTVQNGQPGVEVVNADGSVWGENDPTSLSDIQCYAVMVGGAETAMQTNYCSNELDQNIVKFGVKAGLFAIGSESELMVPIGKKRHFYLVGFSSASGCNHEFSKDTMDPNQYSAPYLIGSGIADIETGPNVNEVQLTLSDSFSDSNKIKHCDFLGSSMSGKITLKPFVSSRSVWIYHSSDDSRYPTPRTVEIEHEGENISCSRDGGVSYGSCDGGDKLIWKKDDYEKLHYVRVEFADGTYQVKSFKPSDHYPNLEWKTCNSSLSGNSIRPFSDISAQLDSNRVICLGDGTVFEELGSSTDIINITQNNLYILAPQGQRAIVRQLGSNGAFEITGSNVKLMGLDIKTNATSAAAVEISNTDNIELNEVKIESSVGSAVAALKVINSGSTDPVLLRNSQVWIDFDRPAIGAFGSGGSTDLIVDQNSHIRSNQTAVAVNGSAKVTVDKTILETIYYLGITGRLAETEGNSSHLLIQGSYLVDGTGGGISLNSSISFTTTLELDNNAFIRRSVAGDGNDEAIQTNGSGNQYLISNTNGNTFCNEDSSSAHFVGMTDGQHTASLPTNWVDAAQGTEPATIQTHNCGQAILDFLSTL